jgi:hypothetical protein
MGVFTFLPQTVALNNGTANSLTANNAVINGATLNFGFTMSSTCGFNSGNEATAFTQTPAFANGTASQLSDTNRDYMVYLTVGTAGTAFSIAIGPTSGVTTTIVPSSTATTGEVYTVRLPAGWFLKWTATTATLAGQLAIGC